MRYLRTILIPLFAFPSTSAIFAGEMMPQYGTAGVWSINVDTTIGHSCFVMAEFDGGSALRFGFNMQEMNLYVLVGDPNWQSIEFGKTYPIELKFGDEDPWAGDATGFSFDPPENQPWLFLGVVDGEDTFATFMTEFMQESNFVVTYRGGTILNLILTDSYKAGLKLFECQDSMQSVSSDPFRETASRESQDLFRY